jgi:tetratricopeptide (TPR) repeat protein
MASQKVIHCSQCRESNSSHRLWCSKCQAALSWPGDAEVLAAQQKELRAAIDLYQRVLADLEELAYQGQVPAPLHQTIKEFYTGRLTAKRTDEETCARKEALERRIQSIRRSAFSGRLREALAKTRKAARTFADQPSLAEVADELETEIRRREEAERAGRVTQLLADANRCAARRQYIDAQACLEEVLKLDPSHAEARALLKQAEDALAEQQRREQEQRQAWELLRQARAARQQGQLDQAEHWLHQALAVAPDHKQIARELGEVASAREAQRRAQLAAQTHAAADGHVGLGPEAAAVRSYSLAGEETPTPQQRLLEWASRWWTPFKPFLLDNVGWFVGAFLIIAGFVGLVVASWTTIERNKVLMHSVLFGGMLGFTGLLFVLAYLMRVRYPELETSSNVLLVVVALLVPLVFASAVLPTLVAPIAP